MLYVKNFISHNLRFLITSFKFQSNLSHFQSHISLFPTQYYPPGGGGGLFFRLLRPGRLGMKGLDPVVFFISFFEIC